MFFPRAAISGSINDVKVQGSSFIGRNSVNVPLHQVCTGSSHFKLHTDTCSFHFIEMYVKQGRKRESYGYGSFVKDKEIVAVTMSNKCVVEEGKKDNLSGFNPPVNMNFSWSGTTVRSNKTFNAVATVDSATPMTVIDVLANIPRLLRYVIQKVYAKPYMYQYLKPATVNVSVGEEEYVITGTALFEQSIL